MENASEKEVAKCKCDPSGSGEEYCTGDCYKQSPESSGLVPLNEEEVFSVVEANNNTFVRDADNRFIAKFICKKFGTQQSKLVPLENNGNTIGTILKSLSPEEYKALQNGQNIAVDMTRLFKFCSIMTSKYGSPTVPSLEEIEKVIYKIGYADISTGKEGTSCCVIKNHRDLAIAIHRLLTNGKEGK